MIALWLSIGPVVLGQTTAPSDSVSAPAIGESASVQSSAASTPPTTVPEKMQAAREAMASGELRTAERLYREVLLAEPYQYQAMFMLAEALRMGERNQLEAVDYYNQFLRKRPASMQEYDGDANFGLGMIYLQAGHRRLADRKSVV